MRRVLVMAGSHGAVGRLPDVVRTLGRLPGPVQAIVVAGHDTALVDRLHRLAAGTAIRVQGYADDVRALMAAADVLVTKAGGMTLAEAMAAELPMVLYGSLPGQEQRNERFAARAGIALAARSRGELGRLLERVLTEPACSSTCATASVACAAPTPPPGSSTPSSRSPGRARDRPDRRARRRRLDRLGVAAAHRDAGLRVARAARRSAPGADLRRRTRSRMDAAPARRAGCRGSARHLLPDRRARRRGRPRSCAG